MKLVNYITLRLSLLAAVVLAFWSVLFYLAIIEEINDETDDSLEDYAELVIRRSLAGEPLPSEDSGSNNQYFLHRVSAEYARSHSNVRYSDRDVFIKEKNEYEPARVVSYIYKDGHGRFFEIEVSIPSIDKQDLKMAIFYWLLFLYVAIMSGIVVVNSRSVRRSMKPLSQLLEWIENYRLGRGGKPLHVDTNVDEFRRLGDVLEKSTRRSENLYEQQKLFIGNASHEMQTPLAICQNRLEMLLDDNGLDECQIGEIIKAIGTLKSLSRLNRSLLMLCKIDNGQFAETCPADFGEMVSRMLPEYEAVFAGKHITVGLKAEPFTMIVEMNPQLSEMLVSNLLKNAFVHNIDGGSVDVIVTDKAFSVANTGHDGPLDKKKVFARFYHTPGKSGSSGLGLALVKSICRRYGLHVDYRFYEGKHVFTVSEKSK